MFDMPMVVLFAELFHLWTHSFNMFLFIPLCL